MADVANYTFGSSFINCLPHLEGEKVFGFAQWPVGCPPKVNNDSHCLDHVNFFHPRVTVLAIKPNIVEGVCM